jgi:hypothetical protein
VPEEEGQEEEQAPGLSMIRGTAPSRARALVVLSLALACLLPAAEAASLPLLDGRGWEIVSPLDKNGGEVQGFGGNASGGVLQAAADGQSATFSSASSFGAEAQGAPIASQYVSGRTGAGWLTRDFTLPTLSGAYGEDPEGVPYRVFSTDLTRGLVLDGRRCPQGSECARSYSLREGGVMLPLGPEEPDLNFVGASPDLRHIVLSTCAALTADAIEIPGPGGCDPAAANLYEWSAPGRLRLLNLPPGEAQGTPRAALAAPGGAVSSDGARVYWTDLGTGNLYLRESGQSRQVDASVGGGGVFQAASADGSTSFFLKSGHLYRYNAAGGGSSTDLTPAGGVVGMLGAAADGSRVYFATDLGLFVRSGALTSKVAAVADAVNYPPATGAARVSLDGTRLAFLADSEVYLYDAGAGTTACPSCNPLGGAPIGPSSMPGAVANGTGPFATQLYKPRALSADGRRLFFDSADPLVPGDTNGERDVYEWEAPGAGSCNLAGGCLELISGGRGEGGASFVDASESGDDVFFLTGESLVPSDPGAVDLYDARVGGGFPLPPTPTPCEGDACQPLPSAPEDPSPGTLRPGLPNPRLSFTNRSRVKHTKKNHRKKHGKGQKKVRGRGERR